MFAIFVLVVVVESVVALEVLFGSVALLDQAAGVGRASVAPSSTVQVDLRFHPTLFGLNKWALHHSFNSPLCIFRP